MYYEEQKRFHEIGRFFTYSGFDFDYENISQLLINSGYKLCQTPTGDVSIMKDEFLFEDNVEEEIESDIWE